MALFEVGGHYPPREEDIERLAIYKAMQVFYEGNHEGIMKRLEGLMEGRAQNEQLKKLYMTSNLADVICTKPSELLLQTEPLMESGLDPNSSEQDALNRLTKENNLRDLVFRLTLNGAIHGDTFLKVYFNYRQDFSETKALARQLGIEFEIPENVKPEIIMQTHTPDVVFPELAKGSTKDFKAVTIAYIEWVDDVLLGEESVPHLVVERHMPFYVVYERYLLKLDYVNDLYYEVTVPVYELVQKLPTGKEQDVIYTGVERPLVFHFAYKQSDLSWRGVGAIEKIADKLVAIADRLTAIDYILHKHSDPIVQGPSLDGMKELVNLGGAYIERTNEDPEMKYVTWEPHLQYNFQELDLLLSEVFLMAQLPSWLFGSNITQASRSGGGTSHTDSSTTKLRYAPVSALLDRLTSGLKECLGDAFYYAQVLENVVHTEDGEVVPGFTPYEPVFPKIKLSTGIPRNDREVVEITVLRFQNQLIDQTTALKILDGLDDAHAEEMAKRIRDEQILQTETVDSSVFNNQE